MHTRPLTRRQFRNSIQSSFLLWFQTSWINWPYPTSIAINQIHTRNENAYQSWRHYIYGIQSFQTPGMCGRMMLVLIRVINVWMFVMHVMIQESVLQDAFVAKECCFCLCLCICIQLMSIFMTKNDTRVLMSPKLSNSNSSLTVYTPQYLCCFETGYPCESQ